MLKSYFKELIDICPSFGSFLGYRKYDNRYENFLHKDVGNRFHELNVKYRKKLMKHKKRFQKKYKNRWCDDNCIDHKMLAWMLQDYFDNMKFPTSRMPMKSYNNPVINFTFTNTSFYPLKTGRDFKNLILRHQSFIEYMQYTVFYMIRGMKTKYVIPKIICRKMIDNLKSFYDAKKYIIKIPDKLIKKHKNLHLNYLVMMDNYGCTLNKLLTFLEKVYYAKCRNTIGVCGLPHGKEMYRAMVKSELTTTIDIKDIHEYGRKEVKRIVGLMHELKIKMGYSSKMSLQTFYKKMVETSSGKFKTKTDILRQYEKRRDEIRKKIIPKYFYKDVQPYAIKQIPDEIAGSSAHAFYIFPRKKGENKQGTFYVNLNNPKEYTDYNVAPLSLHEGEPGHHYQFQYMMEKGLPIYRMFAISASVFTEGWALYAENLGDYEHKDRDYFGKLAYEIFRSMRLVVDTGIHYYGWSYDRALNYMQKYVPLGKELEGELVRYICMPAQALCYKMGEYKILEWKKKFMEKFNDVKYFHKVLLEDGILPFEVLENKIMRIIEEGKKR
jgi:uncharacterized protein (DUF885 family)